MMRGLLLIALLGACADPSVGKPDEVQARVEKLAFGASPATQLDLLIVVDDSPAMAPLQDHLQAGFQQIAGVLDALESGGAPDLHVGVITGDLCTRSDVTIPYLSDRVHAGQRLRSYSGTLAGALGALGDAGATGCDRPQLLEAMRRALSSPANRGFLREHALLQVIFITDEDDRSDGDPAQYASFLTGLEPAGDVMVTGVVGPCTTSAWSASSAPRLEAVIHQLGTTGDTLPICSPDLDDAVCVIARFEPERPGERCLDEPIADPAVCTFADVQHAGRAEQAEQALPECGATDQVPCWRPVDDPACFGGADIRIERGDLEIPFDDQVVGECLPME
jgi:hypothetical protein